MGSQPKTRGALLVIGVAIGLFGAYSLLRRGLGNLVSSAEWLVGGVVLHDFVLAPIVLTVLWLGSKVVPEWARASVTAGAIVLGSVTLIAIPAIGRFGAKSDNATLLDRSYGVGWLVFAGIVAVGVAAGLAVAWWRQAVPVKHRDG